MIEEPKGKSIQADDALRIITDLKADYGVQIEVDFGWQLTYKESADIVFIPYDYYLRDVLLSQADCHQWEKGNWELAELLTLKASVKRLADLMGRDRFNSEIGGAIIQKDPFSPYPGANVAPFTAPHHITFWTTTLLVPNTFGDPYSGSWTAVHELAHAWDKQQSEHLSTGLERYTGGHTTGKKRTDCATGDDWSPGCNSAGYYYEYTPPKGSDINFNRGEDWAESVAAYAYPEIAKGVVAQYGRGPGLLDRPGLYYTDYKTTLRYDFVGAVLNGTFLYK